MNLGALSNIVLEDVYNRLKRIAATEESPFSEEQKQQIAGDFGYESSEIYFLPIDLAANITAFASNKIETCRQNLAKERDKKNLIFWNNLRDSLISSSNGQISPDGNSESILPTLMIVNKAQMARLLYVFQIEMEIAKYHAKQQGFHDFSRCYCCLENPSLEKRSLCDSCYKEAIENGPDGYSFVSIEHIQTTFAYKRIGEKIGINIISLDYSIDIFGRPIMDGRHRLFVDREDFQRFNRFLSLVKEVATERNQRWERGVPDSTISAAYLRWKD